MKDLRLSLVPLPSRLHLVSGVENDRAAPPRESGFIVPQRSVHHCPSSDSVNGEAHPVQRSKAHSLHS